MLGKIFKPKDYCFGMSYPIERIDFSRIPDLREFIFGHEASSCIGAAMSEVPQPKKSERQRGYNPHVQPVSSPMKGRGYDPHDREIISFYNPMMMRSQEIPIGRHLNLKG